jgi:hypothetical protein
MYSVCGKGQDGPALINEPAEADPSSPSLIISKMQMKPTANFRHEISDCQSQNHSWAAHGSIRI